jgi:OmpA-OmpF porin, OOP family
VVSHPVSKLLEEAMEIIERNSYRGLAFAMLAVALLASYPSHPVLAQASPFVGGWDLDPAQSNIRFQSIKYTAEHVMKVESSTFATFSGGIEPDGAATVKVALDSVDTLVDLRNVRMRFLFFETFKYPEATISMQLTPENFTDLPQMHRKTMTLPYTFDLHGMSIPMESPITVMLLGNDMVSVASAQPISIAASDFGLAENITKLEEAVGGISVIPSATVTFDLIFQRRGSGMMPPAGDHSPGMAPPAQSVALESPGDFNREECIGRFEVLSRTGNIYFNFGSAQLTADSYPLLDSVVNIVSRCPDLNVLISGHTDSDGPEVSNQILSEARAASVVRYLEGQGVEEARLRAAGYGEERPVAPNDTAENRRLNRRIEFSAETAGL